jgi:flavin-binding protein dodecin
VGSRTLRGSLRPSFVCQRTDPGAKTLETGHRIPPSKGKDMTVARITEISSVSAESFQDAIAQGVERANQTLKNVKGAWVKDQEVTIDKGKVTGYKVILKVTFVLTD